MSRPQKVVGREFISDVVSKCDKFLKYLETKGKAPNNNKVHERRYSIQAVADITGKSRPTIYKAEEVGVVVPEVNPRTGKKTGYSLAQINKLRDHFGARPARTELDPCLKIAVQSFKGGVAKTVTSVHLAQFLAARGYRVLLADFDPQASATMSFGFIPDQSFEQSDTLTPYLEGEKDSLHYCIKPTYFPGVSLIPSCLQFYDAGFKLAFKAMAAKSSDERIGYFTQFDDAFQTIENDFDFIIIDSPPSLDMVTINILASASAVVVPTPASFYDFSSTVQYFKMIQNLINDIVPDKEYNFIKILATRFENRNANHDEFYTYMEKLFGEHLMVSKLEQSRDIPKLAAQFKTLYDINPTKKFERVLSSFNSVFSEIEQEALKWWPSASRNKHVKLNKVVEYV